MANLGEVLTQLETLYNMAKGFVPDVAKQLAKMRNDLMRLKNDIDKLPINLRGSAAASLDSIVNFIHPRTDAFLKEMNLSKIDQLKLDAQKAQAQIQQLQAFVAANLAQTTTKSATPKETKPAQPTSTKKQESGFNLFGNLSSGKSSKNPVAQAVYDLVKSIIALFQALFGGKKKSVSRATSSSTKPSAAPTSSPSPSVSPTTPSTTPSPTFGANTTPPIKNQLPRKSFPLCCIVETPAGNSEKTHLSLDQDDDSLYTTFGHGTMSYDRYELAGAWNAHTGQQFILRGKDTGRILELSDIEYNGKKVSGDELLEIIKSSYVAKQYPKVKLVEFAYAETIETQPVMVDGVLMQEQYKVNPYKLK